MYKRQAYIVAQKYGVDTSGFRFDKVCEMQGNGDKDPKELRAFIGDIRNAAYGISNHLNRNLGEQEQEFVADEFALSLIHIFSDEDIIGGQFRF